MHKSIFYMYKTIQPTTPNSPYLCKLAFTRLRISSYTPNLTCSSTYFLHARQTRLVPITTWTREALQTHPWVLETSHSLGLLHFYIQFFENLPPLNPRAHLWIQSLSHSLDLPDTHAHTHTNTHTQAHVNSHH